MNNLTNLFKNANVGLFTVKLPGKKIIEANFCFAQILGYKSLEHLFADFVWEKHFSLNGPEKTFNSVHPVRNTENREIRIIRTDGTTGWADFSFGLYLKTGHLQGILVDITDRKRLENEIINISDREKEKFGRDLHDILGQTLTGTAFLCRALMNRLPHKSTEHKEHIGQIESLVNQALIQARHLAHGLSHIEVRPSRIGARLKKLATQVSSIFEVECKAKSVSRIVLPDCQSATHLYRIAQEAVNNAVKHSVSPRIEIRLKKKSQGGVLIIEDFGQGCTIKPSQMKGIGMRLMKLRAHLIGASLKFINKRGHGFKVVCNFPLAKEKAE